MTLQGECIAWEAAKTLGFFVDDTSLGKYFRATEPLALTLAMFRVGGRSRRKLVGNKPGIKMLSCKGTVRRWSVAVMYTTESSRTSHTTLLLSGLAAKVWPRETCRTFNVRLTQLAEQ